MSGFGNVSAEPKAERERGEPERLASGRVSAFLTGVDAPQAGRRTQAVQLTFVGDSRSAVLRVMLSDEEKKKLTARVGELVVVEFTLWGAP